MLPNSDKTPAISLPDGRDALLGPIGPCAAGFDPAARRNFLAEVEATGALCEPRNLEGISQEQLARSAGITQPAVSNILNRDCRPQRRTVARFADALGVEPDQLWPTA